ncbi:MAG: hypothetical protein ABI648_03760 [Betaproteobacteria bacterium]
MSAADSSGVRHVFESRVDARTLLMREDVLVPVLVALHVAAIALIVDGLGSQDHEAGRPDPARQIAEWSPDCVAGPANGEIARRWTSEDWQNDATGAEQRGCVNRH